MIRDYARVWFRGELLSLIEGQIGHIRGDLMSAVEIFAVLVAHMGNHLYDSGPMTNKSPMVRLCRVFVENTVRSQLFSAA